MKEPRFPELWLAVTNLKQRPARSLCLIIVMALLAAALFTCGYISLCMNNGLNSLQERFGADLMAVPLGYDGDAEGILVKGEPSYFYFDRDKEDQIRQVEGVEQVSSQFFLTSTNQDCCEIPVQFIGFDPDTDFSITPWIRETFSGDLTTGDLLVGSDIAVDGSGRIRFFNKEYQVAARLEQTGTGLDQAVYGSMNTLRDLYEAAQAQGITFTQAIDPDRNISSVMIRVQEGYELEEVVHNIRSAMDGTQILRTTQMVNGIAGDLNKLTGMMIVLLAVLFIVSFLTLSIVFSVTIGERRKEFGILRSLGGSPGQIVRVILGESALLSGAGALLGIGAVLLIVLPFRAALDQQIHLPFLWPKAGGILLLLLVSFILTTAVGVVSSAASAARVSKEDAYSLLKEGD